MNKDHLLQPIDRRHFIQAMISSCVACFFLPGAFRRWKSLVWVPSPDLISAPGCDPKDFARFLLEETPKYDALILKDINPSDGWIGQIPIGAWDGFDETDTFSRFQSAKEAFIRKEFDILYTPA